MKLRCSTNVPKYLQEYSKQESQYSRRHTKVSKDFTICKEQSRLCDRRIHIHAPECYESTDWER